MSYSHVHWLQRRSYSKHGPNLEAGICGFISVSMPCQPLWDIARLSCRSGRTSNMLLPRDTITHIATGLFWSSSLRQQVGYPFFVNCHDSGLRTQSRLKTRSLMCICSCSIEWRTWFRDSDVPQSGVINYWHEYRQGSPPQVTENCYESTAFLLRCDGYKRYT